MPLPTKTLPQFQDFVWEQLPFQRGMLGKEVISDVLAVAVQEWPDDALSGCAAGSSEEKEILEQLKGDVRRHLLLTYGSEKFGSIWIIALQILLPIIIDQMVKWWRRRKEHRGRIRIWRRKWVNGSEGQS
jgi:hypothetical protein